MTERSISAFARARARARAPLDRPAALGQLEVERGTKMLASLTILVTCAAAVLASDDSERAPPHTHPVPAPKPRPWESIGSIDVGTLENTIFWWAKKTYVLENIGCGYADHAGKWFPEYANHSYARVRDFTTGTVVSNISSSIGFGFLNAFPDYDHNRLWLFGTPADRCHGNCGACTGASCPGLPSCLSVQSWWTSEAVPKSFETAVAIPKGAKGLPHTYNQGVSRVRVPGPGMPPHGYVMISEGDPFFINNDPDGNLTAAGAGWTYPDQHKHPGGSGGVSMQWAADSSDPTKPGWYYSVTGGSSVGLARSRDLKVWDSHGYNVVMSNEANATLKGEYQVRIHCVRKTPLFSLPYENLGLRLGNWTDKRAALPLQIAPYNGFPESAARKGFTAMADPANWDKW
jgi:hypothetical protein